MYYPWGKQKVLILRARDRSQMVIQFVPRFTSFWRSTWSEHLPIKTSDHSPDPCALPVSKLPFSFLFHSAPFLNDWEKMELTSMTPTFKISLLNPGRQARSHVSYLITPLSCLSSPDQMTPAKTLFSSLKKSNILYGNNANTIKNIPIPTMTEILAASKAQNLDLKLQTLGPFFRITAKSLETQNELGRAEGLIRLWLKNKILHLDSIRLKRETLVMEKSIFGIGLFIGAVAIRYGYDCGCKTAELLAINDSDLYHFKVICLHFHFLLSVYQIKSALLCLCKVMIWNNSQLYI